MASLVIDPLGCAPIRSDMHADEFALEAHRIMFAAIVKVGDMPDAITLRAAAGDGWDTIGEGHETGDVFLARIMADVPTALNAQAYAQRVRDLAQRRALLDGLAGIAKNSYDTAQPIGDILGAAVSGMASRARRAPGRAEDGITATLMRFDAEIESEGNPLGVPFGLRDLDNILGGFEAQGLYTVAGRPGAGKSVFLAQAASKSAQLSHRTLFFSYEMSEQALRLRMAKAHANIPFRRNSAHTLNSDEQTRVRRAVFEIASWPLTIVYAGGGAGAIRARCEIESARAPLGMVVVDYLQIVPTSEAIQRSTRDRQIGEITGSLKQMAMSLEVPVLVGSQLNREAATQKPRLDNMRESGSIENDSDAVIALWVPDESQPQQVRCEILKSRNDGLGGVDFHFNAGAHVFKQSAKQGK